MWCAGRSAASGCRATAFRRCRCTVSARERGRPPARCWATLIEIARHPKPPRYDDPSLRPGETAPIETLTMRYFIRLHAPDEDALCALREPLRLLNAEFHPPSRWSRASNRSP
jgi:hypothetical protein